MKDLYRVFDHFKGIIRRAEHCNIWEQDDKNIWLISGAVAFKVSKNEMELNPAMFKPFTGSDDIFKIDDGELLKYLKMQEVSNYGIIVPMQSENKTVWFNKRYIDLFPKTAKFYATSEINIVTVKNFNVIIGIICPVRHPEPLIDLFEDKP
jgi:hypothetical protein